MFLSSLILGIALSGSPRNLLINGDFRHGKRGFTTSYGLADDLLGDGSYWIGPNPRLRHPGACSIHDHKDGHSPMLLLNGSATAHLAFWSETIQVEPDHQYQFTGWATSWGTNPQDGSPTDYSPARILVYINGVQVGDTYTVNAQSGLWSKFGVQWNSKSRTTATIRLVDENTDIVGNDFAIDDLSFAVHE